MEQLLIDMDTYVFISLNWQKIMEVSYQQIKKLKI